MQETVLCRANVPSILKCSGNPGLLVKRQNDNTSLQRVFYPQNLSCTPKINGSLYMLLYIGGTNI